MVKTRSFIRIVILAGLFTALLGAGSAQVAEAQPAKSLYDRLGGVYPIAVVVDTFIDLLFVNDVLNANPAIKAARERVPAAGLKYHVTALVCQQTGGPCKYTGRGMEEAHAHLNISEKEWQAMLADFRRVLNNYGVPRKEQMELMAIVESTKKDIVVRD
jgi:hemoglobin